MNIAKSLKDLVGNTPLIELSKISESFSAKIIAKLEYFNPTGSAKDRIALSMIECAENSGILKKGATIIEPTSGNTGIGLAAICAARGYKVILTMPDTMSTERRKMLSAYGAELVLTPGSLGMNGAVEKALELSKEIKNSFIPSQFENPANPKAHFETTGPEIWKDTEGKVDIFVATVGTGGTLSGTGAYLKEQNPDIKVVAVEPADSPLLSKGRSGAHKLQGIGANFIPKTLDTDVYDEIITATTDEAYECTKELAKKEGLLVGISSGAALHAAKVIASRPENKDKMIVVLLPDSGTRYISTPDLF